MARLTSTRFQISYVNPTTRDEPADVPADIKRLVDAFENSTPMYAQGTIATRPVAGVLGRFYFATNEGILYLDNGTSWVVWGPPADSVGTAAIADNALSSTGLFTSRPVANTVPAGYEYFASDTVASYRSNGTAWVRLDADMAKVDHFAVVPTAGWIRADNTPITTAMAHASDLRAALVAAANPFGVSGSDPRVPNAQGRVSVDQDGTADFNVVGKSLGAKTVAAPLQAHSHGGGVVGTDLTHSHAGWTDSQGAHNHGPGGDNFARTAGTQGGGTGTGRTIISSWTGNTTTDGAHSHNVGMDNRLGVHGHTINSDGVADTSHNNLQPYIVLPAYIKL